MGAVAIWMLNATIYRPGAQSWDIMLSERCVRRVQDEAGTIRLDLSGKGAYFVAAVQYDGGVYRLPFLGPREMTANNFQKVFNMALYQVQSEILEQARRGVVLAMARNKEKPFRRRQPRQVVTRPSHPEDIPLVELNLVEAGVVLNPNIGMSGVDIDADAEREPVENDIENRVGELWRTMFHNIIALAPSPKNANEPSYCTITNQDTIDRVDERRFASKQLPFRRAVLKGVSHQKWRGLFNLFFPATIHGKPPQGFCAAGYYAMWRGVLTDTAPAHLAIIRRKLLDKWRDLLWVPNAATDRMWDTRVATNGVFKRLGSEVGPAPQIAINPQCSLDDFTLDEPE